MSGHSHFKTIKAQKELADAKKGKVFSKLARLITIAAKEKGGDLLTNNKLKSAIEQAKQFNMPKDNVERAIKKGTGKLAGENIEEVSFEAFGPGGIAFIIEGITDNKNRTISEIKSILGEFRGKMAGEGAVRWMFERMGYIVINCQAPSETQKKEDIEMAAIEAGAKDIKKQSETIEVHTGPEDLEKIKKTLEEKGLKVEFSSLSWIPKKEVSITDEEKESAQKLFDALDENDAVQDIYSNLKV